MFSMHGHGTVEYNTSRLPANLVLGRTQQTHLQDQPHLNLHPTNPHSPSFPARVHFPHSPSFSVRVHFPHSPSFSVRVHFTHSPSFPARVHFLRNLSRVSVNSIFGPAPSRRRCGHDCGSASAIRVHQHRHVWSIDPRGVAWRCLRMHTR